MSFGTQTCKYALVCFTIVISYECKCSTGNISNLTVTWIIIIQWWFVEVWDCILVLVSFYNIWMIHFWNLKFYWLAICFTHVDVSLLCVLPISCFITNGYVALGGILLPCVVCLIVAVSICVQAFVMYQQWGDYDNVYIGRRNVVGMFL